MILEGSWGQACQPNFLDIFDLSDGAESARGQELKLWIVVEIYAGESLSREIYHTNYGNFPVNSMNHMVGAQSTWEHTLVPTFSIIIQMRSLPL